MEFLFSSIMSHFSICFGDSFKNIDLFIISLSGLSFSVNHINDYKEMKKINKINQIGSELIVFFNNLQIVYNFKPY